MSAARRRARASREGRRIALRYLPSTRDLFDALVDRLMASRPVVGERKGLPVYGKPTFRNVIDEEGKHV